MYPVSETFQQAVRGNTRKYYWTGKITTAGGVEYPFDQEDIVKGSGYVTAQCCGSSEIELGAVYAAEMGISLFLDIDRYTLEIPAGGRDSLEEKTYDCAARELEEETGFRSDHLELLIQLKTAVAYCNEFIDVYVAKDLVPSHQHLDEDEFINVCEYTVDALCEKIFSGEIQDAKTIAAIMAYKVKYQA